MRTGMTTMEAQKPAMKDGQRLLCVEGLIGVGKTQYIEALGKRLEFYAIPEPVLEWRRSTPCSQGPRPWRKKRR